MLKYFVLSMFFLIVAHGWAQEEEQQTSLTFSYQYGKLDAFPSLQLNGKLYKAISFESSLGVGFRTTILQGRLFPQFTAGVGYNVLGAISEKIALTPLISTRVSGYRLSPLTRLQYCELMPGYSFMWGSRVRLVQSAFFGKGWEWSQDNQAAISFWTFSVNLGIGYVF